jgi:tripartite-type tricarboxylate transporter receptor subunit TctC
VTTIHLQSHKLLSALGFAALLCMQHAVAAEQAPTYPNKPIHLVVPFPAGGSADLVARIMAKPLGDKLGQPVVIDNKPGADGAIAAEAVAAAAPDGYTLFMATYGAMSAVPSLHKAMHYDPVKDFTPISSAGKFSMFLFAHPSVPAQTLNEFIAYEHTHTGEVNYGTGNVASIVMAAEMESQAKLHMTQVPYKGEVPAMTDFVAGRIQLMFATPANALPFVKEGKLKVFATLSDKRSPLLPETPTWHEAGMLDLPIVPWAGVFGPAKLPKDMALRLSQAIQEVLLREDVHAEFAKLGFEPFGSSPEKLDAYAKKQHKAWHTAIQSAGLQAE